MNVYEVLLPARYLPRLFGSAPFGLSRNGVKFSRLGQILPFIYLPIVIAVLYISWDQVPLNLDRLENFNLSAIFWLKYVVAIVGTMKDSFYQRQMIDIVRSIDDYDKKTGYDEDNVTKRENENIRFWGFAHSIALVIFSSVRFLFSRYGRVQVASEIIVMQADNPIYMFAVLTNLLGMRFRYLNSIIEQERGVKVRTSCSASASNPEYVRSLYTSLVRTVEKLNDHYSSRLFLWSARTMLSLIMLLYNYWATEKISLNFVAYTMSRILPTIVGLLIFTISCQFTIDQANKTSRALLAKNIRLTAQIDRGRKEIFTMSLYMALRPLTFSALGFFSVDLSLAHTILAVTMTYLALSIQIAGK